MLLPLDIYDVVICIDCNNCFIFSSPDPEDQVRYRDHLASVVVRKLLHFNFLQ